MTTKHTHGPWMADRVNAGLWEVNSNPKTAGWSAVCEVRSNGLGARYVVEPETEANAHLIAAAPELLDACKAACDKLKLIPAFGQTIGIEVSKADLGVILENLKSAIAKAEGK